MVTSSTWGVTVASVESSIGSVTTELDGLIGISMDVEENLGQLKEEVTIELQNELQLINDWMTNLPKYQQYVKALYMGKNDLVTLENIPRKLLNFHNLAIPT